MANFITTLSKLTSLVDYPFRENCVKSTFALTTYSRTVFTTEDILNVLALPQTTDVNGVIKKNFLDFQALAVLNSTLPNNLLIHSWPNAEAL